MKITIYMLSFFLLAGMGFGQEADIRKTESFWPDGKMKSVGSLKRMPDGKFAKDGRFITWFENGKKQIEQNYREGNLEGMETRWYTNGQKELEGRWVEGKRHGTWRYWHRNGDLKETRKYENGRLTAAPSRPQKRSRSGGDSDSSDGGDSGDSGGGAGDFGGGGGDSGNGGEG
ncbi:MAG: hypothetical protein P9M08_12845 [Candidatus Erginobacter occultus]|nr:hypothetical protein [Candidatus Erginobacter occultus]